jgi:hypothetical protein
MDPAHGAFTAPFARLNNLLSDCTLGNQSIRHTLSIIHISHSPHYRFPLKRNLESRKTIILIMRITK